MARTKREPIRAADGRGMPIVRVPVRLPRRLWENADVPTIVWAVVDAADFDRARAAGMSDQWVLQRGGNGSWTIRAHSRQHPGRLLSVPGFLLGDHRLLQARYKDRDRLNLRRENLELVDRVGRVRAPTWDDVAASTERAA